MDLSAGNADALRWSDDNLGFEPDAPVAAAGSAVDRQLYDNPRNGDRVLVTGSPEAVANHIARVGGVVVPGEAQVG
jgi:hypothetical protein